MQYTKSVNTSVCISDLVIIKYFGNNIIQIKRIVFTYPDLLLAADDGCQHPKHVEPPTEM